jgi:hypothetical protein
MRNHYRLAPAFVALLVLAGCAAGDDQPPPSRSVSPSPSPTPTPTPTPTATPTPTPTEEPGPQRAKDGRNLDACRDQSCEVEVRAGDTIRFDPEFVARTVTVDDITDGEVSLSVTDDYDPSGFSSRVSGDGAIQADDLHVDIFHTDDGRVILRIS